MQPIAAEASARLAGCIAAPIAARSFQAVGETIESNDVTSRFLPRERAVTRSTAFGISQKTRSASIEWIDLQLREIGTLCRQRFMMSLRRTYAPIINQRSAKVPPTMERPLRNLRRLLELLMLVLFFGPIIAVCMMFDDWLDPIVFTAFEPGTFPFTVFRLVELAAGFGFVYACWLLIGDRLNEMRIGSTTGRG